MGIVLHGTLKLGPPLTIPDDALIEGLSVYEECDIKTMFSTNLLLVIHIKERKFSVPDHSATNKKQFALIKYDL